VSRTGFRGRLVAALLGACAAPYVARASAGEPGDSVVVDDAFEERALGASLALFEDETAAMTLDDVRTPAIAQRFVPARVESPSLGYTASTWWARFTIDDRRTPGSAAAEEPLVVTLAYAQTDEARLACTNEEGAVVVRARAGDHVPHEELPSAYREPSFEIPRTARTCWIDVHTTGSVQFPVTLRSFDRFVEHRVEDTKLQFLYFGALLVMIAYNALVALAAGSRAYAAYTSFLVAHGLVQVLLAGVTPRWLAALVSPADRLIPLATSLTGLTSLVFTMILLDVRARTPRLAAIAKVLGIYLASHAALSLFMPYHVGVKAALVVEPFWAALLVASRVPSRASAWRSITSALGRRSSSAPSSTSAA